MRIPSRKLQSDIDSVRELRSSRLVSRDTFLFCSPGVPRLVARRRPRAYIIGSVLLCCCGPVVELVPVPAEVRPMFSLYNAP